MIVYILLINLIITGVESQDIERVVVPHGQPFTFDCQLDESVYFARRLNEWAEIQENNEKYLYMKLSFNSLTKENILRVTSDSAESKHSGFYGCRKASWTSTLMNTVYQLILADVQSFYWNFICHGPIGSCQRSNDLIDENSSRFEVADQTNVELFCCASVTGYKTVALQMNQIGHYRGNIEVNKKQELDGTWVICADQRTILKRTPYNKQQTFICELTLDNRQHSTLSSLIIIKDAMLPDSAKDYSVYSERNQDGQYFNQNALIDRRPRRRRRRLTMGKKIAIILGSVLAGVLFLGLVGYLVICICRRKKTSSRQTPTISRPYVSVKTEDKSRYKNEDVEPAYEEPTALSEASPVFMRC